MRYSLTAAAMVSMAMGAIAGGHNHAFAHRRLHAREAEAIAEPEPTEYSWSNGQCFGTWGCMSSTTTAASTGGAVQAAAAPANPTPAVKEAKKPAAGAPANPTPASPTPASNNNNGNSAGSSAILAAIQKAGMQAPNNDGTISTSQTGSCTNEVSIQNNCGKDMLWVCWGAAGSWVNAKPPIIAQAIPQGASQTLYFAEAGQYQQGGACAPVFADTTMSNGQIKNTWVEYTFKDNSPFSVVDVSKEVTMSGTSISVTTGGCTSDMHQCSFACTNGQDTCGEAGTYALQNSNGPGCMPDPSNTTGGCNIKGDVKIVVG